MRKSRIPILIVAQQVVANRSQPRLADQHPPLRPHRPRRRRQSHLLRRSRLPLALASLSLNLMFYVHRLHARHPCTRWISTSRTLGCLSPLVRRPYLQVRPRQQRVPLFPRLGNELRRLCLMEGWTLLRVLQVEDCLQAYRLFRQVRRVPLRTSWRLLDHQVLLRLRRDNGHLRCSRTWLRNAPNVLHRCLLQFTPPLHAPLHDPLRHSLSWLADTVYLHHVHLQAAFAATAQAQVQPESPAVLVVRH